MDSHVVSLGKIQTNYYNPDGRELKLAQLKLQGIVSWQKKIIFL